MAAAIVPQCYPSRRMRARSPAGRIRSSRASAPRRAAMPTTCCCSTAPTWSPTRSRPASTVERRWSTPTARERAEIADARRRADAAHVDVASSSTAVMDALSPVRSSSAIVAHRRATAGRHDARFTRRRRRSSSIAVDVQDPGNVGAIVRVAEAAGATGVVAAGHRRSVRLEGAARLDGQRAAPAGRRARRARAAIADARTPRLPRSSRPCRAAARSLFDVDLHGTARDPDRRRRTPGCRERSSTRPTSASRFRCSAPVESLNAAVRRR